MFEPDEFLFTKLAYFFKRKKQKKAKNIASAVDLVAIKPRLTLLARALTGEAIDIYAAQREGGYKNTNFFLPARFAEFSSFDENLSFYFFRIAYLTIQKKLNLNWKHNEERSLEESQQRAAQTATTVLGVLMEDFPVTQQIHQHLITHYTEKGSKEIDFTFIYGKWMKNQKEKSGDKALKNFTNQFHKKDKPAIATIIKATAIEEIITIEVDKKQQEDAVLLHQFEKVETVDEFGGNWKDFDGEDELADHSNALDEINMKFTVRVDDPAHSVYQADFIENTTISESAEMDAKGYHLYYDEWNYRKRQYKERFCKVYPKNILKTDVNYYKKAIIDNKTTLLNLRKLLSTINNKYQRQRRQKQGGDIDIDAATDLFVDIQTGFTPTQKIYLSKRKKEKDLSILLLLDTSLSSDAYAAGNRIIDVEKQASIIFGEILNEYNIDFAINAFSSKTRNFSNYVTIKDFEEDWNRAKFKIGTVEPSGYTRIGVALRHSAALLDLRATKNKWIILLSDGKPNDYDRYEGVYGIKDIKQALKELNERRINAYALAIEAEAKYYLPQMFGQNHYQILTRPIELIEALGKVFEKIKYRS